MLIFRPFEVSASLPGASPETMASAVATPLEKQFSTIAGLDSMSSYQQPGQDFHHAAVQSEPRYRCGRPGRPDGHRPGAEPASVGYAQSPLYRKVNPADQSILMLSFSSSTLPLSTVDEYAETYIAQRLSMVSGVAQVQVFGPQNMPFVFSSTPTPWPSRGIGIDEVAGAVQKPTSSSRPESSTANSRPSIWKQMASSPTQKPIGRSWSPTATERPFACRILAGSSTVWKTTRPLLAR